MIKEMKLINNQITAIIENSDTNIIPLSNLTNLDGTIIATIWWSGAAGVKNIYLIPAESLTTYIYKGRYGMADTSPIIFGETLFNVASNAEIAVNAMETSNAINWSNTTDNATLTLLDGSCIAFDAIVIRANQDAWQVMLAADALTQLNLIT